MAGRRRAARGDSKLAADLTALAGQGTRSVAAALVDLADSPNTRTACIDAESTTRFEIGSITKVLTGMALADAIERGEVALDSTIDSLLPESGSTDFGSLSLKELCTHNSGLPRMPHSLGGVLRAQQFLLLGSNPFRGITAAQVVGVAACQRLRRRGHFRYSNLGAAVVGQLLAHRAGCDYGTLVSERVFAPLDMRATVVATPQQAAAPGWSSTGRRRQPWVMGGFAPAGGVVSTIDDMVRLAKGSLCGVAPGSGSSTPIAGVASRRANQARGMFWVIDFAQDSSRAMIWHNGQTGGYSSFLGLFPDKGRAVVVLANVAKASELQRIALGLLIRSNTDKRSDTNG